VNSLTIKDGWLDQVEKIPSPNFEERPQNAEVALLVVHAISLPPGQYGGGYIQQFFINRLDTQAHEYFAEIAGMRVSAHCLVERSGNIIQFVSFDDRAWHAGASIWGERENCNDFSIGIELEGCDDDAFEPAQYEALAQLVICLRKQYPAISEQALCGHSDIAPGRKTDPGPCFDWAKLTTSINNNDFS
jgi:AmpD protein